MPLLVNLELADITGSPLSTLNAVTFNEAGVWKIVQAIHERTGNDLTTSMLKNLFDAGWGELSNAVNDAIGQAVTHDTDNARPQQRDTSVVLEDLVEAVSDLRQHVTGPTAIRHDFTTEATFLEDIDTIFREQGVDSATSIQVMSLDKTGTIHVTVTGNMEALSLRHALARIHRIRKYNINVNHKPTRRPRINIDAGADSLAVSEEKE
jgi:hypothetical protein